jgi:hypothetical protein
LEASVAGDKRKAKAKRGRGNDAIWHIGNSVAGNILKRVGHISIHGSDK